MKTRGTRGGIVLSLDAQDTVESLEADLEAQRELLSEQVFLEVAERLPWSLVQQVDEQIEAAGGQLAELRPPGAVMQAYGQTKIIVRTVRSGGRVESTGPVVILGDVNSGAEIIADGDIIVVGTLRGLAHAGANGNEKAIIWAQKILSPQLRIGSALAQAGERSDGEARAEIAHLSDGQIVLRPWDR